MTEKEAATAIEKALRENTAAYEAAVTRADVNFLVRLVWFSAGAAIGSLLTLWVAR